MPELPDIEVYVGALRRRVMGRRLESIQLGTPFVLRSVDPPPSALEGHVVRAVHRRGKRMVLELDDDLHLAIHLMIAGRLHWREGPPRKPNRATRAALRFQDGTLELTEAGSKQRAAIHLARGRAALEALDRGGLEPLTAPLDAFEERLRRENHTLKRALTDPSLFSGIGNAYSDEILHHARLSPFQHTRNLTGEEVARLHEATQEVLRSWWERLRREAGDGFPEKVTAFRPEMAVHGRFGQPCPRCGAPVQRIVYAENEANYCAPCQTGGRLLADRSLSRLLREDWPKTWEELEARKKGI